jgi:hypothetical protein
MSVAKEKAEEWFESYLDEREVPGGDDHEPDLGGSARPDYRIGGDAAPAICEVKQFTGSTLETTLEGMSSGCISSHQQYGTVRNKMNEAAKRQLREYADRGEALIVVLANPLGIRVPIYTADDVLAAMYGDQGYTMEVDASGIGHNGEFAFLDNGVFGGGHHRYVSGVVTLHRRDKAEDAKELWIEENRARWDGCGDRQATMTAMLEILNSDPGWEEAVNTEGHYFLTHTYETAATATGEAVAIPHGLFTGPKDEFWAMNKASGLLELVHGGKRNQTE